MVEPGFSFPRAVWTWLGYCMVVVLLIGCLKNMGEMGEMSESNGCWVAFGIEMPLAEVDCLIVAGMSLWEPLGLAKERSKIARLPSLLRLKLH